MSLHAQDDPALRAAQEERLREVWKPPTGWFFRWTDTNNNQTCDAGEQYKDVNNNGVWDADGGDATGGAKDRVVYTVVVTYPRLFPIASFVGLPTTTTVKATTVLENQPYADQTQYGTATLRNCS